MLTHIFSHLSFQETPKKKAAKMKIEVVDPMIKATDDMCISFLFLWLNTYRN